jgi:hypothetical protein
MIVLGKRMTLAKAAFLRIGNHVENQNSNFHHSPKGLAWDHHL